MMFLKIFFNIILFLHLTKSEENKCIVHRFANIQSIMLPELGSDLIMENSNLEFDELMFINETKTVIQSLVTKILSKKRDKTNKKLLLITGDQRFHAEHYENLCYNTHYRQVHFLIGHDWNPDTPIKAGREYNELAIKPERCNSKFNGYLEERSVSIANGFSIQSTKPFESVIYDMYKHPSAIRGVVSHHYIYIGFNSATTTYGCGRSYIYSEDNMQMFIRFLDTRVHYNLYMAPDPESKITFETPINIVSSYPLKGSRKFYHHKTTSIAEFYEFFNRSQALNLEFDMESYESGWNQLNTHDFKSEDFSIVKNSIAINYDYDLVTPFPYLARHAILWHDTDKGLPTCHMISCFFITFKKPIPEAFDPEEMMIKLTEMFLKHGFGKNKQDQKSSHSKQDEDPS